MRYRSYQSENMNHIWAIILINLLVYIATLVNNKLILKLAVTKIGSIIESFSYQPWTIITSMFTHSIPLPFHLLVNMVTFYFFSRFLTRLIGARNLLLVYFCGGIVGSIFFLLLEPPVARAVGASGAVFALGGVLTILTPKVKVFIFPIPVPIPLWIAIIGIFLLTITISAWQAHLGGLIVGLLFGLYYRNKISSLYY